MSFATGFAAGIGTGIAIGVSSGQGQGKKQVCDFLETNEIALFDQQGNRISIEDIRGRTKQGMSCHSDKKLAVVLGIGALVLFAAIALVVFFLQ